MKFLYTFLIVFSAFALSAQISHRPNPLAIKAHKDSTDVKLNVYLNNEADTTYEMYWKLVKDTSTWMKEWATYICDSQLCYNDNRDYNSLANSWPKGETKLEFHFKPNGKDGCTIIKLILYGDKNFTQEIYRTSININNCISNSVNVAVPSSNIKLYPNPASEYFQISNDSNVDKIKVYNMFGREIKSFYHYNNAQHEIGELKSGMYILKMIDEKGRLVKTMKLNKVYSGA